MARFDHVGIVARDSERLAEFYERVLGCTRLGGPMALSGDLLERGVGLEGAEIHGIWLQLPGHGEKGPILEVFQYTQGESGEDQAPNKQGVSHISFEVDDVVKTAEAVVAGGGSWLGEIVDFESPSGKVLRYVYLRDPEGNILELERTLPEA